MRALSLCRPVSALVVVLALASIKCGEEARAPAATDESQPDQGGLGGLAWMQGYWSAENAGARSVEVWLPAEGGVMVGVHVDRFASGRSFFEYLRIEDRGDTLVYFASPRGRPATSFAEVEVADDRIIFSNPEHEYPQFISYSVAGPDSLRAEIWGVENGEERRSSWVWGRGRLPGG